MSWAIKEIWQAHTGSITEEEEEVTASSTDCVDSDGFASVVVFDVEGGREDRLADCE